jgi:hypothetical protein
MSYDVATSSYHVRFDCAEFGSEDCPDTEVASHGGAVTLVPATSSFVSPPAHGDGMNLPTGSRKAKLCGTFLSMFCFPWHADHCDHYLITFNTL